MILTDAGPLVALIDRGEVAHARCVAALSTLRGPMVTTWPAFTEAMYLLGSAAGWPAQDALWRLLERSDLELIPVDGPLLERARALMERYHDTPIDLADATLVAVAEARGLRRIFTLDRHFHAYRIGGRHALTVIP